MIDSSTIINTCYQTTKDLRVIAQYSHVIPVVLSLFLAVFVFVKSKFNLFSKVFLMFVCFFSLWLLGDLVIWNSERYNLIYTIWSLLDYIEIIFFVLGLYFALVFVYEKDLSKLIKILFFVITIPPFIITITQQSVLGLNQPVCEAVNSDYLTTYKLVIESGILLTTVFYIIRAFFREQNRADRKADLIVLGSLFTFLSVFGISEYISSTTGIYEINLYSLFILPLFLISIIYAVFELDIFHFEILGTHYLVVGLVILMGGQLFFINGATDSFLTVLTIILSIGLSAILFRNLKRESDQRVKIERLSEALEASKLRVEQSNIQLEEANDKLKGLDKLKTEFLSLASHQLRSPLTAIKGYTSMLLEGDYGAVNAKAKEAIDRVFESSKNLTIVVEDLLNVSKIEQGGMKYEMVPFDLGEVVQNMAKDLSITADKKGLKLTYEGDEKTKYMVNGDKEKLRQVVLNFIDNSIKYTKTGTIKVSVANKDDKVVFAVKDTGMGMTPEIKASLFQKFARGDGARMNTSGSGLGLYLAKEIVSAHKGRVWVDSDGPGLGSTFCMELDAVKA